MSRAAAAIAATLLATPAAAADCRVTETLVAALPAAAGAALQASCGCKRRCAAEWASREHPEVARLVAVGAPDTDVIRWARTAPSIGEVRSLGDARLLVRLDGFGRTAARELRTVLTRAAGGRGAAVRLVLDLSANGGGDLGRMLEIAAALSGAEQAALRLVRPEGVEPLDLAATERLPATVAVVLVGAATASSGEVLAALLVSRARATLCGERTAGKGYAAEVIPVDQRTRLLVRVGTIEVAGMSIAGGLRPERARAECLAEGQATSDLANPDG